MRFVTVACALAVVVGMNGREASAGAPGSADRKAGLQHVCETGPLGGQTCDPAEAAPCGTKANGDPHLCVPDLLKRPILRGTLTVTADENPADNVSAPGNPTIGAVLEIKLKGKTYLFAKSFQSSTPGSWPEIATWLASSSEAELELLEASWPYQAPRFALTPFEDAIEEMTEAVWPGLFDLEGRFPMIVEAEPRYPDDKAVDQFGSADVGQVVRLKVRIQYAAPLP